MKHINKIGVEIEGGWDVRPADLGHDASVKVPANHVGEARMLANTMDSMAVLISRNYPQHVDSTCGLHVHLSFVNPNHYLFFTESGFTEYLVEHLRAWAESRGIKSARFWDRLNGNNKYCKKNASKDRKLIRAQYHGGGVDDFRYAVVNFAKAKHGTIEVRVLPAFRKSEIAVEAVRQVVSAFSAWIEAAPESVSVKAEEAVEEINMRGLLCV